MSWLAHWMGLDNASGAPYLFLSGIGANFGELTIIAGLAAIYRRHTCHVHHCPRIARHPVAGTGFTVCRRHHPSMDGPVTAQHIANAHNAAT